MWSSRLFWKLFLSYALLNLAGTVTFVVIVSGWQEAQVVEQIKQRLHDSAALVRSNVHELLPPGRTEELQNRVIKLGHEIETRITVVSMNGDVLADSSTVDVADVAAMENHQNRPELVQASSRGQGDSQRTSPTLGEPLLYVALRVDQEEQPVGMVRTALPMTRVLAEVAEVQRLVYLVAVFLSVAVLALTYFVVARLTRPVRSLTEAAEAIATGDYHHRVYLETKDELGVLAKSFNRMSDRLQAREQQLRASRQRLSTVLEGIAEGVIALDEREHIVLANAAAGRLLDFAPADVEGRPLLEVVRNHAMDEVLSDSQATQSSRRVEIELGDEDGRIISVYATTLSDEPETHFILVLQDFTELRRLESLRQEFVANVSHELKTPLSAIKAYAETLSGGALNDAENSARFVQRIEEQADRLHELILDLLRLARIESGQQAFDIGAVELEAVVTACLAEQQAAATAKSISLTVADGTMPLQVRADEEGLRQILNNLIDNAVKYTPSEGAVTVNWRQDETMAVLEVRDTGIGISAEHLPRVFERFYRADKARSRKLGGTGLGLSIVKHLAQSFGGGVEVESQPGVGTVFTVTVPRI